MKILHICPKFPIEHEYASSGVINVVYNISNELFKQGHAVSIYTSADGPISKKQFCSSQDKKKFDIIKFKCLLKIDKFYFSPSIIPFMYKNLYNFDIVHVHDIRCFQSIVFYLFFRLRYIPYIVQPHGSLPNMVGEKYSKKVLDLIIGRRILNDANKIIALTKDENSLIKMNIKDESKIVFLPNGINISDYRCLPNDLLFKSKYNINKNSKIILFLGRINKIKGINLLVLAYSKLLKEYPNTKLVIAGPDDGFLKELKKFVDDLKLKDEIIFTGPLYNINKLEAYVSSDLYVLPSIYETFPITVLEALACGIPVIVTDCCGISDIVNKVGYVVRYDEMELKNKMIEVLYGDNSSNHSRFLAQSLIIENFNWSKIVQKLESIYNEVIQGK